MVMRIVFVLQLLCAVQGSHTSAVAQLQAEQRWFSNIFSSSRKAPKPPSDDLAPASQADVKHKEHKVETTQKVDSIDEPSELADDDSDAPKDAPNGSPPLIGKLRGILVELKERKDNIQHLEKTLAQEKAMLDEGKQMLQLATTKKGKRTFGRQVQNSEQIYKDTSGLLADSRNEAKSAAQNLIKEMEDAREIESDIISEARGQLRDLAHGQEEQSSKNLEMNQVKQKVQDSSQDEEDDATDSN